VKGKRREQEIIMKIGSAERATRSQEARIGELEQTLMHYENLLNGPLGNLIITVLEDRLPTHPCDSLNIYKTSAILSEFLNELERAKKYPMDKYPDAMRVKKGFPFRDWFRNDKQIQKAVSKNRFVDVMDYVWKQKNYERSVELENQLGIKPAQVKKRKYGEETVHWILVQLNFKDMATVLSKTKPASVPTAYKTVQAIVACEIFEDMGVAEQRTKKIYKIGRWHWFWDKGTDRSRINPVPLLNKKKHQEKLRHIKVLT
jgi:hypothetical protein